MKRYRIKSHKEIREEMKAVARGEKPAPADAAQPSFESAEVLLRLLTPENRDLLKIIRDERPQSVADLARLTRRAGPNLLRTLAKLEAIGLIEMQSAGKRKIPVPRVRKLRLEIDPFSQNDRFEVA
jgi:predicted transcriptional regulator